MSLQTGDNLGHSALQPEQKAIINAELRVSLDC